jgi:hypothetical protein
MQPVYCCRYLGAGCAAARRVGFVVVLLLLAACNNGLTPRDSENSTVESSGIVVSAQTDRTNAALDETIRFTLSAAYPQHVQVHMPESGALIAGLRIVDFGETGPSLVDDRLVFEKWFDLRADLSGTYIIPSMTLRAVDRDEIREITTPQIFIKVGLPDAWADNATMQDIIGIKPPVVLPRDVRPYILGGAIVAVLVVSVLGLWLYVRKKRVAASEPPKPAHVLAYEQLEQLEQEGLVEKGIVHEHYVRLSDIFRHYLQNRFHFPAVEQTTQEQLRSIKGLSEMPVAVKTSVRDFLLHADLVKFAKYHPGIDDIENSQQQVRDIIDQTRQEDPICDSPHTAGRPGGLRK